MLTPRSPPGGVVAHRKEELKEAEAEAEEEIVRVEDLGRRRSSEGERRGGADEATPLRRIGSLGARQSRLLTRQTSVMDTPIITDASGAMKLTFWV